MQSVLTQLKSQCILHRMDKIFSLWPTVAELARDIGENPITVRAWRRRRSIPADRDLLLVEAARRRGAALTLEDLAAARRRKTSEDAA